MLWRILTSASGHQFRWGYDPEDYFAPDRLYASDQSPGGPTREFKAIAKAFHDQVLKVYVDKNWLDYSNVQTFASFFHFSTKLMALRDAHPTLQMNFRL